MAVAGGSYDLVGCRFLGNGANPDGGGFFGSTIRGTVNFEECEFEENRADFRGGALAMPAGTLLAMDGTRFVRNRAPEGGAIYVFNLQVEATRVLWRGNVAPTRGGGLFLVLVPGARFERCTWMQNESAEGASLITSGPVTVIASVAGDTGDEAFSCPGGVAESSCTVGGVDTEACFPFAATVPLALCPGDSVAVCGIPEIPECGPLGFSDHACADESCLTPTLPASWGLLKLRYRGSAGSIASSPGWRPPRGGRPRGRSSGRRPGRGGVPGTRLPGRRGSGGARHGDSHPGAPGTSPPGARATR
jgi:hypothetical protein